MGGPSYTTRTAGAALVLLPPLPFPSSGLLLLLPPSSDFDDVTESDDEDDDVISPALSLLLLLSLLLSCSSAEGKGSSRFCSPMGRAPARTSLRAALRYNLSMCFFRFRTPASRQYSEIRPSSASSARRTDPWGTPASAAEAGSRWRRAMARFSSEPRDVLLVDCVSLVC